MPLAPLHSITPDVLQLIGEIDEFKAKWHFLASLAPDFVSREQDIRVVTIGASTGTQGRRLSDLEVDRLLANLDLGSFRTRDEQEVAGYAEATALVFRSHDEMPLTEETTKALHAILVKYSPRDKHHAGKYKEFANNVEAFDEKGRVVGIIFKTADPAETPRLMKELLNWTTVELRGPTYHPILVIAVFVVRFLAIHPFQDGNGRLARVITNLMLMRAGYTYMPYSSLERVIEENREQYYRALRSAQSTLDKDESHLMDWIRFFLLCLIEQKNSAVSKFHHLLVDLPSDSPGFLLQAVITPGKRTMEGTLVDAVAMPWYDIIGRLVKDPTLLYKLDWRKFEEIIAGAYKRQGFEVTLTPRSRDGGRDVIAVRHDIGSVRFFDQVKRYSPGHVVTLKDVDTMLGVLSRDSNVSKGIVTTTATFAPELERAEGIKRFMPYRLELKDRHKLIPWLESLLPKQ